MAKPSTAGEIPISDLQPQQLNQLSQQLDQEIEYIQSSLGQLKGIQTKFTESQESLGKITKDNEGKEILVPLTSSMYVQGQLADLENVLIDIGTGYYAEMSKTAAIKHFQRKIAYLTKQMEKIQPQLAEKYKMKQAVVEILQTKVQTQLASQQQAQTSKS